MPLGPSFPNCDVYMMSQLYLLIRISLQLLGQLWTRLVCAWILIYKCDREANPIERRFLLLIVTRRGLHFPRGGMLCQAGPHGEAQGLLKGQMQDPGESVVQSFYCVFHGKGKAGSGNGLRLASLNDVGRLWAIWVGSVVVWVIQGRRNIGLVCQLKEVVGGLDPELIGGSVL